VFVAMSADSNASASRCLSCLLFAAVVGVSGCGGSGDGDDGLDPDAPRTFDLGSFTLAPGQEDATQCVQVTLNNDEPVGTIGAKVGGVYAGSNEFQVKLSSKGGHGAAPHQAPDLIVVASHLVLALQTVVSRSVDPCETAVVTVGMLHAGTKSNILPTQAHLEGTVRTFDKKLTDHIKDRIETIAKAIAQAHGAGMEFAFQYNYPATINAPVPTALVRGVAEELVGRERVSDFWTTGSEDMSRFLDLVPGCYWSIGSRHPDAAKTFPHHSGRFNPEESALPLGVEFGLRVIRKALA
jgi:amidohydrolase